MRLSQVLIFLGLAVILGVPFLLRPAASTGDKAAARTLVIVTPHVPQIRDEFARAFEAWHLRETGVPVRIDFRVPGGTSDIIKQLQAQYNAAIRAGLITADGAAEPGTIPIDLMFGGGSYDHGRLAKGDGVTMRIEEDGETRTINIPMSVPAGFEQSQLDEWYGPNQIGAQQLYDPQQYWLGTALSSFGIVYNKDVLARLGVEPPKDFTSLTDPTLRGWVVLADPRQSGSIATTFDSILSYYGWDKGWRILREMSANTRYFTNSSTKPPIDVSQGEAAMGLAIDFYGRGQSQAVVPPGGDPRDSRVGYIDPAGSVYIDADPVSILRGGPNPDLARSFVAFTLTPEAQALWQFPATSTPRGKDNPTGVDGQPMGPVEYELRRMPVRRIMYDRYFPHMIDRVDPFALASKTEPRGWRSSLGPMMGAFAIDIADEQRSAWAAIHEAKAAGLDSDTIDEMESHFYAWPLTTIDDPTLHPAFKSLSPAAAEFLKSNRIRNFAALRESLLLAQQSLAPEAVGDLERLAVQTPEELTFTADNFRTIREYWRGPGRQQQSEVAYTLFFRAQYRRILELASAATPR